MTQRYARRSVGGEAPGTSTGDVDGVTGMSPRSKKFLRIGAIAVGSLAAVVALGLVLTSVTASPKVCGSCHEMQHALVTWQASGHTQVGCADCHEEPREWYQFPQTLAARGAMLARDVRLHWDPEGSADIRASLDSTPTITDATCLQCHNESRKISMRFGTLIDHQEHAERNKQCVSCHLWTAHPEPTAEKPMLMMEQCFTCHGRTASAKAPGTCDVCHPASFNLRPVSHKPEAEWKEQHGQVAKKNKQPCAICHDAQFCTGCHGVVMPHPANWSKGKPPLHSEAAKTDRTVCVRCHDEKPDLCSMCHHKGWDPTKGAWIQQHPVLVANTGSAYCLKCHDPVYCTTCHARGMKIPGGVEGQIEGASSSGN